MKTVVEVMKELEKNGSEQTRKTFARHGAPSDMFGVKVADLKVIAKKIKGNQQLAMELFDTGNSDAMYLAGLVADGSKMSRKQLDAWAKGASWSAISEYTVPWNAAENSGGWAVGLKWIESKKESIASCGWATLSSILAIRPDGELDLKQIQALMDRAAKEVHSAPNRVRSAMNGFVIAVGAYVKPLLVKAKATAKKIGVVDVDMGDTACKVPVALPYIEKIESMGRVGKKRMTTKC